MTITICHLKSLASRKTLCVGVIINDDVNIVCRCGSTCQLDARRHGGQRSVLKFAVFTDNNLEYRTFYFPVGLEPETTLYPSEASMASITILIFLPPSS